MNINLLSTLLSPFTTYQKMKKMGILGMNRRNAEFIAQYNPRKFYPLVDNKLMSKSLASKANIAVPELYAVIEMEHQVVKLDQILAPYSSFVIKPAQGSGGDGIIVIMGRRGDSFKRSDGVLMRLDELKHHVSNILSGMYSLGGHPDHAMIEYRVEFDPLFREISYQGVPDIRVIVFQGYPVMSMVRLPTRMSSGKANLHQGAVGVGINIATGMTHSGVWQNHTVEHHTDTGYPVSGLEIPGWERLLSTSAGCYELTGLGYIGVDLVLDGNKGPLMLELNARPGLAIQIANRTGLAPRLDLIKQRLLTHKEDVADRVKFVQETFA
ncbi:MAG: alpha-L-glutamate ligase-like protein [Gammaproteobacteria bacterium]|jgi:alpha-L-glutamate ligase-like protein